MFAWLLDQIKRKTEGATVDITAQRGTLFKDRNNALDSEALFTFTLTRDDLALLTERIISAIPKHMLTDADRELTITVNGGFQSGKKIIPDITRDFLLTDQSHRKGIEEIDEYVSGEIDGKSVTISFINAVFDETSFFVLLKQAQKNTQIDQPLYRIKHDLYLAERPHKAGISFVHNCHELEKDADINIWIEGENTPPVFGYAKHIKGSMDQRVRSEVGQPDLSNEWIRYVEINIRNKELLADQNFMTTLRHSPMLDVSDNHSRTPIFKI